MKRREFLKAATWMAAGTLLPSLPAAESHEPLRIALLHLAPVPGDHATNRLLVARAVTAAAEHGASWIITPELCTSGYTFAEVIGTDWIRPQPDEWMQTFYRQVVRLGVTVFLSLPEKDPATNKLHNSMFVIGPEGNILGRHRKIQTLSVGSETWSSPGRRVSPTYVDLVGNVGVLICADAYPQWIARKLKDQGARILISPANWGPGPHGPNGEWERCTRDTGLPLLVCNRTGVDGKLDFTRAVSVVVRDGRRQYSMSSGSSAIFLIDWDTATQNPVPQVPRRILLPTV